MDPWIQFFKTIMDFPVPEELTKLPKNTAEIEMRDKSLIWKIKAEVAKISYRMFTKYADPEHDQHK